MESQNHHAQVQATWNHGHPPTASDRTVAAQTVSKLFSTCSPKSFLGLAGCFLFEIGIGNITKYGAWRH